MSNNSKPYQALLLARAGFRVPPTRQNDPEVARAFYAEQREVIYKSASGIRSIVRRLEPAQLARLDLLRNGPAQFQRFVPGHNVRVHTVDDAPLATRVTSDAVGLPIRPPRRPCGRDGAYRAARIGRVGLPTHRTRPRAPARPASTSERRRTASGTASKVNPCPGFLYYERQTSRSPQRSPSCSTAASPSYRSKPRRSPCAEDGPRPRIVITPASRRRAWPTRNDPLALPSKPSSATADRPGGPARPRLAGQ